MPSQAGAGGTHGWLPADMALRWSIERWDKKKYSDQEQAAARKEEATFLHELQWFNPGRFTSSSKFSLSLSLPLSLDNSTQLIINNDGLFILDLSNNIISWRVFFWVWFNVHTFNCHHLADRRVKGLVA